MALLVIEDAPEEDILLLFVEMSSIIFVKQLLSLQSLQICEYILQATITTHVSVARSGIFALTYSLLR